MPAQVNMSDFVKAMSSRGAAAMIEAAKGKEVQYDTNAGLPAGIEGGIAQLVDIKLGVYQKGEHKGEWYFMASAVCVQPVEFNGVICQGGRTQIGPEALCNTPKAQGKRKTLDDHMAFVVNEIGKLFDGKLPSNFSLQTMPQYLEMLKKKKPYIKFRTWKGKPQKTGQYAGQEPRVQHVWNGTADYTPEMVPGMTGVEDDSEDMPNPVQTARKTTTNGTGKHAQSSGKQSSQAEPFNEFSDTPDLDALVKRAMKKDAHAQKELERLAEEAGVDAQAVADAESWQDVADMIRSADTPAQDATEESEPDETGDDESETDDSEEPEPEPEPEEPKEVARGDVYEYRPLDKSGNPGKKSVTVEVTHVNKMKGTATVKDLASQKVILNVPFDQLQTT